VRRDGDPWATTPEEHRDLERGAAGLVGTSLVAIRYFAIDYHRLENPRADDDFRGDRLVTAEDEWSAPHWRQPGFDALDFGVELDTFGGSTFSSIWEQAGPNEGITLQREPLRFVGSVAIWDVTARSRWTPFIGQEVDAVELFWHRPDRSAGLCCVAATLRFGGDAIHLALGDADDRGNLVGSFDNVVVLDDDAARRFGVGPYAPADHEIGREWSDPRT
jgi:hypothetical protein